MNSTTHHLELIVAGLGSIATILGIILVIVINLHQSCKQGHININKCLNGFSEAVHLDYNENAIEINK